MAVESVNLCRYELPVAPTFRLNSATNVSCREYMRLT